MGLNNIQSPGFNAATEFQASALPWCVTDNVSGSVIKRYDFPNVTKYVGIINNSSNGNDLKVAFTENGFRTGNFVLFPVTPSADLVYMDLRVKTIYTMASGSGTSVYSILAGLTMIPSNNMPVLTGSVGGVSYWQGVG
jgi:hypothetical protein